MYSRIAVLLYIAIGLPIGFMIIQSKDQTPWLVSLGVYCILAFIAGSWAAGTTRNPSRQAVAGFLVFAAVLIALGALLILYIENPQVFSGAR